MARYIGPDCKLCRRAGDKLFLKGTRCATAKCAIEKKNYPPGPHKRVRGNMSDYAIRLKEKQKLKRIYGVLERQFRRYFKLAEKQKGNTGLNFLRILETRLDNVVYALGLAASRDHARQIVCHGHIKVNSKKVDIPSYAVRVGNIIEIDAKFVETETTPPAWLELDSNKLKGKVTRLPVREDITTPVEESLVVELYSR